jgi:hypothetical protein
MATVTVHHFTLYRVRRFSRVFSVLVLRMRVHIEDSKANAGFRKISADSHFDGRKAVVGKRVSPSYYRQHIDSSRKPPDGVNFAKRKGRAA